jgi:hypothetical protein
MSIRNTAGKYLLLIVIYSFTQCDAFSQLINLGVKAGYQFSWVRSDDLDFRANTKISPVSGFNAGLVTSFKIKERYFLHTEYLFSTKGKRITEYVTPRGNIDPLLDDKVTYYYIDVPVLYNIQFKSKVENKYFKWHAGIGPLFSFWLGGKGTIVSQELIENEFDKIDYKIKFGHRQTTDVTTVYIDEARRLQLGLTFGGGIMLEPPNNRSKFMFDLRFEMGGTWLGDADSADYLAPSDYDDNVKARNMGLRFSIMYLYQADVSKKGLNKGKSTKKVQKRRT